MRKLKKLNKIKKLKKSSKVAPDSESIIDSPKEGASDSGYRIKNSEITDYYKLLNVPRTATKDQITEGYRSIAKDCAILLEAHQELKKQIESEFSIYQKAFKTLTTKTEKEKFDFKLKLFELKKKEEKLRQEIEASKSSEKHEGNNFEHINTSGPPVFRFNKFKIVIPEKEKFNNVLDEKELEKKKINEMLEKAIQLIQKEDYDNSIDILMNLIDIKPEESLYHSYFGLALLKKGWENLARDEFRQALTLNIDDPIAIKYNEIEQATKKTVKPETLNNPVKKETINIPVKPNNPIVPVFEKKNTGIRRKLKEFYSKAGNKFFVVLFTPIF